MKGGRAAIEQDWQARGFSCGVHGAMNKERQVCARRRDGEAAGSSLIRPGKSGRTIRIRRMSCWWYWRASWNWRCMGARFGRSGEKRCWFRPESGIRCEASAAPPLAASMGIRSS